MTQRAQECQSLPAFRSSSSLQTFLETRCNPTHEQGLCGHEHRIPQCVVRWRWNLMLQRGSSQPSEYLLSWLRSSGHRGRRSSAAPSWLKQRHINVGKQLLYFIHQLEMFNISSIYLYRNVARRLVTVNAPVLRVDLITCFGYRICQEHVTMLMCHSIVQ